MKASGVTDIGKVREANQDQFAILEFETGAGLAVVCDGMGGPGGGQIASSIAVRTICDELKKTYRPEKPLAEIREQMRHAVSLANAAIFDEGLANRKLMGMGTTVVLALYRGQQVLIGNVGDSRAYLIRDGQTTQISKDHSIVQQMLDSGSISRREARNHPQKNIITRALGVESNCDLDLFEVELSEFDSLLLCTDGLSNLLYDRELGFEISVGDRQKAILKKLVSMANSRGGTDNITAVLLSNTKI